MGHQLSIACGSNLLDTICISGDPTPGLGTTGVRVTTNSARQVHSPQSDTPLDQKYTLIYSCYQKPITKVAGKFDS